MAPRARPPRKNRMGVGNTRMDAALDSMRQLGFHDKVVQETVDELLDVYDGNQGWPFIEEASYKLLIETILAKQQSPAAEQQEEENPLQDHTRDEVIETSATPTTEITEVGSSSLVAQDCLLQINDGLDSASQTNDEDLASLGNETGVKEDSTVPDERGGHEQEDNRVESRKNEANPAANVTGSSSESTFIMPFKIVSTKSLYRNRPCYRWGGMDVDKSKTNEPKPVDNVIGSGSNAFDNNVEPSMIESSKSPYGNHKSSYSDDDKSKKNERKPVDNVTGSRSNAFVNNVKSTFVKPSMIESSKSPYHNRKPSYGWRGSDDSKSKNKEPKLADNVTGSRNSAFVNNVESTFVKPPMIESSKSPYHNRKPSHGWSGGDDSKSKKNEPKSANNVTRSSRGAFISNVESTSANNVTRSSRGAFISNVESTSVNDVTRSSRGTFISNVESTFVKPPVIESSKSLKNPHYCHRKPFCGWIDDDNEEVELTTLPIPPLPEHIEELFGKSEAPQSSRQRRRKSRWDEKPEGM